MIYSPIANINEACTIKELSQTFRDYHPFFLVQVLEGADILL
jgi:hypothetical protein